MLPPNPFIDFFFAPGAQYRDAHMLPRYQWALNSHALCLATNVGVSSRDRTRRRPPKQLQSSNRIDH